MYNLPRLTISSPLYGAINIKYIHFVDSTARSVCTDIVSIVTQQWVKTDERPRSSEAKYLS